MKERRRRDKISDGLRQLRQALPAMLLGPRQDMASMIEAAIQHIGSLESRIQEIEAGGDGDGSEGESQKKETRPCSRRNSAINRRSRRSSSRGGGREGCDAMNDRAAVALLDARREQTQHDGAGPASRVATETASAADVEHWLRALEEVSGAADRDIAGAALAPGLQIPLDLLQQSADAALFAQLQMLSAPPFDAPSLDLHDAVVTRPVTGGASSLAQPARNSFAHNVPMATSGPIARHGFSATLGAKSPRLSATGSVSDHNQRRFATRGREGDASRNYQASTLPRPGDVTVTTATQAEREAALPGGDCRFTSGSGSMFPPISPTGGISPHHPATHSRGASGGAAAASQKVSLLAAPSAAGSGALPPSKCASSKLALEMLHKMRQGGLVLPGVLVPGQPKQPILSAADAAMLANDGTFAGFDRLEGVKTDLMATRAALIGMRGTDASGALLIGSRPSQPAVKSPSVANRPSQDGVKSPRAQAGEAGTPDDARGSGDGSTQALDSPRVGTSGAGGAAAAAAATTAAAAAATAAVRVAGVKAQTTSEGRGGAGPATSTPLSGGGAGLSGGLSAEDDWRPRSRTRFDAEAMRKGEIKPRSMKERRRRDKISEGLRQLRQAIPESLLGAQQDMGAMIEAAVIHISNLQARVSKLERGAAIEEIVDRMQP
ncbi:unnamed protein product [Closterium sp. Yama58-4]|nr:unnamed protein product [Closterium sp. Yama58-4]